MSDDTERALLGGLVLLPDVLYTEDALTAGLGITVKVLRRTVRSLRIARARVYRGADVLEQLKPCPTTQSASTSGRVRPSGGSAAMSPAKKEPSEGGAAASGSSGAVDASDPVAMLRRWRASRQEGEQVTSLGQRRRARAAR